MFLLDDFFLLSDVNTEVFCSLINIFKDKNVGSIILHDDSSHIEFCQDRYDRRTVILTKEAPFRVTTQATLFRRKFLLKLLRRGESAWAFEFLASHRSKYYKELVLYRDDSIADLFNYPHGGVVQKGVIKKDYFQRINF